MSSELPRFGAVLDDAGVTFRVPAPGHNSVDVVLCDERGVERATVPTDRDERGFFVARVEGLGAGARYLFRVDGEGPFPDPWALAMPSGPHAASAVVDLRFAWSDASFPGVTMDRLVVYELHVGTFTPEGTFDAIVAHLDELRDLGVNAIELLPIATFPGRWSWGYDGVDWNAPAEVYGGPAGLARLVDAAHARGLAVIVDVVYNHFGPAGNYVRRFGDVFFTDRHQTPWGEGINYDGDGSDIVRELVLANVDLWIRDYHVDGLRLDATHAIQDDSTPNLLQSIAARAKRAAAGRDVVVLAEDERNDARLMTSWGLSGVWADDFHHQVRRLVAGDHEGYFADFEDRFEDLVTILEQGWLFSGQRSEHLGKARGTPGYDLPPSSFVHAIQNHDQVGNRALGDRLGDVVSPSLYRALTTLLLLSPYTPLLFMGQEWNAKTPFRYFSDHEPKLGELVTEGRRKEFARFASFAGEVPDPQDPATFLESKLDRSERDRPMHRGVLALHRELLALRRDDPSLARNDRASFTVKRVGDRALRLDRGDLTIVVNLGGLVEVDVPPHDPVLFSEATRFGGELVTPSFRGDALIIEGPSAIVLRIRSASRRR